MHSHTTTHNDIHVHTHRPTNMHGHIHTRMHNCQRINPHTHTYMRNRAATGMHTATFIHTQPCAHTHIHVRTHIRKYIYGWATYQTIHIHPSAHNSLHTWHTHPHMCMTTTHTCWVGLTDIVVSRLMMASNTWPMLLFSALSNRTGIVLLS